MPPPPLTPRLIIYLFVFNKKPVPLPHAPHTPGLSSSGTRKIYTTIIFQVESCAPELLGLGRRGGVGGKLGIKIYTDVVGGTFGVGSSLGWSSGVLGGGGTLPRLGWGGGQKLKEPGSREGKEGGGREVGGRKKSRRGQRGNPRLPGHQRASRSRGMSPGEEPLGENASAPQHAPEPRKATWHQRKGSCWRSGGAAGELQKLTCAPCN